VSTSNWRVGIDVGGTFTDVVAHDRTGGTVRSAKVATRGDDPVQGLRNVLAAVDLAWDDVADLVHGTTLITNAIVEDRLAPVALVATAGFADSLAIGRQNRRHLYRLDLPPKAAAQVPEERRFEVDERIDHNGGVLRALDPGSVEAVAGQLGACDAAAVAVCLLHGYANPAHEDALGRRLAERHPHIALSHEVNPEAREYERTATTALSASLMPLAADYLDRLDAAKPASSRLHMFHSAGGMASADAMRTLPLGLALSGPAAGVAAAATLTRELALDHAISFDMGGTTTDVCLITNGQAEISSDRSLAGRPLRQPMVAVDSIGAGGGSIAVLDHGALRVGPESAGANPGPACYGMGGKQPTVSDANLVLGYLERERVLGDGLALDAAAAEAALDGLAASLDRSREAAALGVLKVATANMVRALRRLTVERGIDGRRCALIAFGGAGPMHAVAVARSFGMTRIVVPAFSSVFSALGCVHAEMSYSRQQTVRMAQSAWNADRLAAVRSALREALEAPLRAAGVDEGALARDEVAALRYSGQSYAVEIPDPDFADPDALGRAFVERHRELYGFATDEPWELVTIRQRVRALADEADFATGAVSASETGARESSCVFDDTGAVPTPRIARASLVSGVSIVGPAIVEDAVSTIVLPPGAALKADARGNLLIDAGEA
jgi:N-methylhydantoinase A